MIKKYFEFFKENISNIEKKHHSIGEWVEKLCSDRDILELMKPYLDDTNPTVKIANVINTLNINKKNEIYKIIKNHVNDTGKKTDVRTFVDLTNESIEQTELMAGKNVFNTFLKIITSLKLHDTKPTWENIPDDFLLFFEYKCDTNALIEKIKRFPSLGFFLNKIPQNNSSLYYGIKIKKEKRKIILDFNFGFKENDNLICIGSFKINNSVFNKLKQLESPSSAHLRKELAYLNINKLILLAKVALHMKSYEPGDTEDRSFKIEDGILEFGYKGLGTWKDGKMDDNEKHRLRKGFTEHLLTFSNKDMIEAKVSPDEKSWIRLNIKSK